MAFKVIVLCALLGWTQAVPVYEEHHGHHEDHHGHHEEHHEEHHAPAHYEFSYSVHDPHTHDIKSQHESRHHDKVVGEYSLVEPDGHKRTVKYTADKHNGFNAEVHREGTTHHVPERHHIENVVVTHHAPVVHHVSHAPVVHHISHAAPAVEHHISHVAPIVVAHHESSHGHEPATSHANIQIHHYDDHHDGHSYHHY